MGDATGAEATGEDVGGGVSGVIRGGSGENNDEIADGIHGHIS